MTGQPANPAEDDALRDHPVQYVGVDRVDDPLVFVSGVHGVGFDETVEVQDDRGEGRLGSVLEISRDTAVVQVLGGTMGLSGAGTRARFLGRPFTVRVGEDMLGRAFDGLGRPSSAASCAPSAACPSTRRPAPTRRNSSRPA